MLDYRTGSRHAIIRTRSTCGGCNSRQPARPAFLSALLELPSFGLFGIQIYTNSITAQDIRTVIKRCVPAKDVVCRTD